VSAFLIDVEGPDHAEVVKTSMAKLEILKSQIKNSQLLVEIADKEIQAGIQRLRDNLFLSQQSHVADLIWIVGELKGTVATWGDDEFHIAASKERVQHLLTSLSNKIKEM